MAKQKKTLGGRELTTRDLAHQFVDLLPDDVQLPDPDDGFGYLINPPRIELIGEEIQLFIAEVISTIINAGSERDAVMQSEHLRTAIIRELEDWATTP